MRLIPEILVEHDGWQDVDKLIEKCFDAVMTVNPKHVSSGRISFLFAGDEAVQMLNRTYRTIDAPTNVLSFPSDLSMPAGPEDEMPLVGDVALAFETCQREAKERGIHLHDHAAHLILHGTLHLFGYDHIADREAEVMERLETELLAKMGIADPYRQMEKQ